jgi:hypothetical protein
MDEIPLGFSKRERSGERAARFQERGRSLARSPESFRGWLVRRSLPENVNYAVKSSYLLSFLESVPDVASKLKEASAKEKKFEDVVKEAEQAAVLVLVY